MRSKVLFSVVAALAVACTAISDARSTRPPRGSASIGWSIVATFPATCARAGATFVSLVLHRQGSVDEERFVFPCTASQATTPATPVGTYDATLSLHAADGAPLAVGPTQAPVTIGADQVIALAPVEFIVEGGKLALTLTNLSAIANCTSHAEGGAGITGNTIKLVAAEGACAAVTFARMRGAIKIGEYTVNCTSPQISTCIERDEILFADGLRSGPYVISASANVGVKACGFETDVLTIPAGATAVKHIQFPLSRSPECRDAP